MKASIVKTAFAAMLLVVLTSCSISSSVLQRNALNRIHPGMSYDEVIRILGNPDFRRFNQGYEELEFRKWISGYDGVVVVGFEEGRVVSMDSFERPEYMNTTPSSQPTVVVSDRYSSPRPSMLYRMGDDEFQKFCRDVKAESFSSDRDEMLLALSKSRSLTCAQCAKLLSFYTFSDEKMNVVKMFAAGIYDKENYRTIQKEFTFSSDKDHVKSLLGF